MTFLITEKTVIEFDCTDFIYQLVDGHPLLVKADAGYTGGIRYYNSLDDSSGKQLTVAELAEALETATSTPAVVNMPDYFGKWNYMRLEADSVSGGSGSSDISSTRITKNMFTVDTADETYSGSAIIKSIMGKNGNKTLVQGTDYTVTYANNINIGTATITITGVGNYTGTLTYTFTIKAAGSGNTNDSTGGTTGDSSSGSSGGSSGSSSSSISG